MRNFIEIFDRQYQKLHGRSGEIIQKTPPERLYWQPRETGALFPAGSVGELVLRSAGAVEQTFGGITTRLWDDPFEWTLPEALSTSTLVLEYLEEAEQTRRKGFALFQTDEDLRREIPAPEKLKPLFEILLVTLLKAENFQGRAESVYRLFSGN
jgi:hypothetical protein